MSTQQRKIEIQRMYDEGYAAAKNGKTVGSCPYIELMDKRHWYDGFRFGTESAKESQKKGRRIQLYCALRVHLPDDVVNLLLNYIDER